MSKHPNQPIPDGIYKIHIVKPKVDDAYITVERKTPYLAWNLVAKKDQGDASEWEIFWSNQHVDKPDALMTITPKILTDTYVTKRPQNELLVLPAPQVKPDENLWNFVPTDEKDTYFIADVNKQEYWVLGGQPKAKLSLGTSESNRVHVKFEHQQS